MIRSNVCTSGQTQMKSRLEQCRNDKNNIVFVRRRSCSMDENAHKIKKISIIFFSIILAVFLIWNIVWLCYRQKCFASVIQNSTLFSKNPDIEYAYLYQETDEDTNTTYSYSVFFPHYLRFDNSLSCIPSTINNEENGMYSADYVVGVSIKPFLFDDCQYIITISDLKTANELFLAGKNDSLDYDTYYLEVNDELEIVKELTYGGAAVMERAYPEVEEMFQKTKAVFGIH